MSTYKLTSYECTACVIDKFTLHKLKKWNMIALCACCILGAGGMSFTIYLYNKHFQLKKIVRRLELKVNSLTRESEKRDISELSSRKIHKESNRISTSSFNSDSDSFETPSQSPTRSIKSVDLFLEYEKKVNKNDTDQEDVLDDNRNFDQLQMQTLEKKRIINFNKRTLYEQDSTDSKNCIDYIKSSYALGEAEEEEQIKKELRMKSYYLSKSYLDLNSKSYLAHKWFAITLGRIIDYMSVNEKVKLGFEFKNHLDIAISLNDSDYMLFYLRGRWSYRMCNLSWAERYGIRLIFGKVPNVNIESAVKDFLKVEELHNKKSKGSTLYLSKCYINQNEIAKAIEYLKIALELPVRTNEHLIENEEVISLLKKYSN